MSDEISEKKPSRFWSKLIKLGCFIIAPLFMGALFCVLVVLLYLAPYRSFSSPEMLPDFELPSDSHFWSLQEKILDARANKEEEIRLTVPEYNAHLSKVSSEPKFGYYHQKTRFINESEYLVFCLIGSGYLQKMLNIKLEFAKSSTIGVEPSPSKIWFNKLSAFDSHLTRKLGRILYKKIVEAGEEESFRNLVLKNFPRIEGKWIYIKLL